MQNFLARFFFFATLIYNFSAHAQLSDDFVGPREFTATPAEGSMNGETDEITDEDLEGNNQKDFGKKGLNAASVEAILNEAEVAASVAGRSILTTARVMIQQRELVLGSCWDYIDAIYRSSGYPQKARKTIFKGYKNGPYAKSSLIRAGDWLYFINRAYHNIGHSAVFVAWTDAAKKEALMISYSGGNQRKPARYHVYNIGSVYNIMRPYSK